MQKPRKPSVTRNRHRHRERESYTWCRSAGWSSKGPSYTA